MTDNTHETSQNATYSDRLKAVNNATTVEELVIASLQLGWHRRRTLDETVSWIMRDPRFMYGEKFHGTKHRVVEQLVSSSSLLTY